MPLTFILFLMPFLSSILKLNLNNETLYPFLAMIICTIVLLLNIEKSGMKLIFLGTLLNVVVMALNHFQMPLLIDGGTVSGLEAFYTSVKQGDVINYAIIANGNIINTILGKHVLLPESYPLNRILSLGDIIISLGIIFLIQEEMRYHVSKLRGTMVNFSYRSRSGR